MKLINDIKSLENKENYSKSNVKLNSFFCFSSIQNFIRQQDDLLNKKKEEKEFVNYQFDHILNLLNHKAQSSIIKRPFNKGNLKSDFSNKRKNLKIFPTETDIFKVQEEKKKKEKDLLTEITQKFIINEEPKIKVEPCKNYNINYHSVDRHIPNSFIGKYSKRNENLFNIHNYEKGKFCQRAKRKEQYFKKLINLDSHGEAIVTSKCITFMNEPENLDKNNSADLKPDSEKTYNNSELYGNNYYSAVKKKRSINIYLPVINHNVN